MQTKPIVLNDQEEKDLVRSREIEAEVDRLYAEQDKLLEPICKKVTEFSNKEDIRNLFNKLPSGFYRSELRTLLNFMDEGC